MKYIGYIVTTLTSLVVCSVWSGYALSILWGWFIVPAFSLPSLSVVYAIGLAMVVSFLTQRADLKKDDREYGEILLVGTIYSLLKPATALGLGYVLTLFM